MVDEDPLPTEVFWFRTPVGQYIRSTYHREVRYRTGNLEAATYLADTAQLQLVPSPPETATLFAFPQSKRSSGTEG